MAPPGRRSTTNSVATTSNATTATRKSSRNSSVSPTPRDQVQQQQQVSESTVSMKKKSSNSKKKTKPSDVIVDKKEKDEKVSNDDDDDRKEEDVSGEDGNNEGANDDDDEDDDDIPLIRHKDVILKKKAKSSTITTTGSATTAHSNKTTMNTNTNEGLPQRRSKRAAAATTVAAAATTTTTINTPASAATTRKGTKGGRKGSTGITKASINAIDEHDSVRDGEDNNMAQNDTTLTAVTTASNNDQKTKRKSIGNTKAKTGDDNKNDPLDVSTSSIASSSLSLSTQKQPPQVQRRFTRRSSTPMSNTSAHVAKSHQQPIESLSKDPVKEHEANNIHEKHKKRIEADITTSDAKVIAKDEQQETISKPSQQRQRNKSPIPSIATELTTSIKIPTPNVISDTLTEIKADIKITPTNNDLVIAITDLPSIADKIVATKASSEPTTTISAQNDPVVVVEVNDIKDVIVTPAVIDTKAIATESVPSVVTATVPLETSSEQVQNTIQDIEDKDAVNTPDVLITAPTLNDDTALGQPDNSMDVDIHISTTAESSDKKAHDENDATMPIVANDDVTSHCDVDVSINVIIPTMETESILSSTTAVTKSLVDSENTDTAMKSDTVTKTTSGDNNPQTDASTHKDLDDTAVMANPDVSELSTSNDCIDPTIPIPTDTAKATRPALKDQNDVEVDDLVCQEDESAFDFPIPIHQTHRKHEPSAPILHSKEKMEPGHKTILTTALTRCQDVSIAPIASHNANDGMKDLMTSNVAHVTSDEPECMIVEIEEVVQTSVDRDEAGIDKHVSRSIDSSKGLNEPNDSEAMVDNPTIPTDRTTSEDTNAPATKMEMVDIASQVVVLKVDLDAIKNSVPIEQVPVNSEHIPDSSSTNPPIDRIVKHEASIKDESLNKVSIDDKKKSTKRELADGPFTSRKKIRALPGHSSDMDIIRVKRPNLTKIKQLLYSAGKLVHGKSTMNYDKLFGDYWSAFSRRIESPMNTFEMTRVQSVLNSFLKSTSLRKLHNQLILGLMERCLDTKVLLSDIAGAVPRTLQEQINTVRSRSLRLKRKAIEGAASNTDSKHQPQSKKFQIDYPSYNPIIFEPASAIEQSTENRPEMESMRVPGALIIDPQVRKLADSHGLKVTEHAVWLLTVAVKEFATSFISKVLSTKEAVTMGRVPPHLTRQFVVSHRLGVERSNEASKADEPCNSKKVIDSSDLHTVIANLPISSRSLSGSVSRTVFERSLSSAVDSSFVLGGSAFDALKKHIIKKITPIESKGPRSDYLTVTPTHAVHHGNVPHPHDNLTDRITHPVRGLGRGAKDLAALKARASSITSRPSTQDASALNEPVVKLSFPQNPSALTVPETGSLISDAKVTKTVRNIQASPIGHRSAPIKTNIASQKVDVSAKDQPEADLLERVSGSSETSDAKSLSQGSRRGKGHGVKNLAAMRARSVTSSSDLADDLAEAATADTVETPMSDALPKPIDSDLPCAVANESDATLNSSKDGVNTNLNSDSVVVDEGKTLDETPKMKPSDQPAINESIITVEPLSDIATLPAPSVVNVLKGSTAPIVDLDTQGSSKTHGSSSANKATSFEAIELKRSLGPTIADSTIAVASLSTDANTNITANEATTSVNSKDTSPKDQLSIRIESNLNINERNSDNNRSMAEVDGDLLETEVSVKPVMQSPRDDSAATESSPRESTVSIKMDVGTIDVDRTNPESVPKGSVAAKDANSDKPE